MHDAKEAGNTAQVNRSIAVAPRGTLRSFKGNLKVSSMRVGS